MHFFSVVASYNFANLSLIAKILAVRQSFSHVVFFSFTEHPHLYVITMSVIFNAEITTMFSFIFASFCRLSSILLYLSLYLCLSFFIFSSPCMLTACWTSV